MQLSYSIVTPVPSINRWMRFLNFSPFAENKEQEINTYKHKALSTYIFSRHANLNPTCLVAKIF